MKNVIILWSSIIITICALPLWAGTPELTIDCKSSSGKISFKGYDRQQEGFDLKIKIDNNTLRYVDACNDVNCTKHEKQGDVSIVDALDKKVFTIYFTTKFTVTDNSNVFMGYFIALPETVKYKKTERGYQATYKGLYWGGDPRSDAVPNAFLDKPVEMACTQKSLL